MSNARLMLSLVAGAATLFSLGCTASAGGSVSAPSPSPNATASPGATVGAGATVKIPTTSPFTVGRKWVYEQFSVIGGTKTGVMEQKWECTEIKPNGQVVIAGSLMTPSDKIPWLGSAPGESLSIDQFKTEVTEMVTVPAGTFEAKRLTATEGTLTVDIWQHEKVGLIKKRAVKGTVETQFNLKSFE